MAWKRIRFALAVVAATLPLSGCYVYAPPRRYYPAPVYGGPPPPPPGYYPPAY